MITKEQAIYLGENGGEVHNGICRRKIGPRGGIKYDIVVYRANGKCKTWKTRPNDFRLPIKYGMYGPYGYITPANAQLYHLVSNCPVLIEGGEIVEVSIKP